MAPVNAGIYGDVYLLEVPNLSPVTYWMVGRHRQQKRLATALREKGYAREFVADHFVRLGLRHTDVPPTDKVRQVSFGESEPGDNPTKNFVVERVNPLLKPVDDENAAKTNRASDQEKNVETYWDTRTPESHHIVEFNHLSKLSYSNRRGTNELDHGELPCVLLMAEFHQRYVSSILKLSHGWEADELRKNLRTTYLSIYSEKGDPLWPLLQVAQVILEEVNL